jgi:hypothetical protein
MQKILLIITLFLLSFKDGNAQKYYDLGSYKNSFTVERSLKAFFFGYSRTVVSLNKYQLSANVDGFYTNNLFGYRAILSNRILLSQNRKHRILNRVGYASSLNENSINRPAKQTPHWLLANVGYEYFIQNKLGLNVSAYQYFKSDKTITDISIGMVLMF